MNRVHIYEQALWPLFKAFTKPNPVHDRMVSMGARLQRSGMGRAALGVVAGPEPNSDRLRVMIGTNSARPVALKNPMVLAAGFDKDGQITEALERLGFGSVVVGTVVEHPQPGNPKPTIFRPAPGVILNRMGFPSDGMAAVRDHLDVAPHAGMPLGISLGLNKGRPPGEAPVAYAALVETLGAHAAYFEINVSSPNTPGLRALQGRDHLVDILQVVQDAGRMQGLDLPLFVKIAPDLTMEAIDDVIETALDLGLAGIVATNTTINTEVKARLGPRWIDEAGGVSGLPLQERSTEVTRHIYQQAGHRLDVIGSGGVHDLDSLLEKLFAGASAVQIYTALIYRGPALINVLNAELDHWMQANGVTSLEDIRGERR